MRHWRWLLVLLAAAGAAMGALVIASGQSHPMERYARRKLVSGEWSFQFASYRHPRLVLAEEGPITGFAFGPGRAEVAYCAPAGAPNQSALWTVAASVPPRERQHYRSITRTDARPRLLWMAPEGVVLRGPVWWAPDGSKIAVRAFGERPRGVVAVDYGSGQAAWLCESADVVDLVWGPRGERITYVTQEETGRAVWVQSVPPIEAHRLGEGGFNVRWSLDGRSLRWLRPKSETVWVQATWDAGTGEITEANPQPARPDGTVWSPDGQHCAVLEPSAEGQRDRLVIYSGASTVGEEVPLTGLKPRQLLGWSPDSRVVLVLEETDVPLAVSARPIPEGIRPIAELRRGYSGERAAVAGPPIDARAGAPYWSSGCDMLAYVVGEHSGELLRSPGAEGLQGSLVAAPVEREHLEASTPEKEEAARVLYNMKNVALALQMYLADNDDVFLPSEDSEEAWWILDDYVRNRSVFMRPGTEDDMVVQYLVPPGIRLVDVDDPVSMPAAVVDYHPGFYVVAYGDGHVMMHPKHGEYWEEWEDWWREFWEKRGERMGESVQ